MTKKTGLQAKEMSKLSGKHFGQLLRAEGGAINPDVLRKRGLLIGVLKDGTYMYPIWQFEKSVYPHLKTILKELDTDNMIKVLFFLTPNTRLNNMTPLQAMRRGKVGRVVMAARDFAKRNYIK